MFTAAVIVGNPKPQSRTRDAAERLASALGATSTTIEVSELGAGLLGFGDPLVADAVARVQDADLVIAASPTFKGTYSGLLKLFLDQFATATGLAGRVAVPLMLGAGPAHALAPELSLKPVLVELGAICPAQGLYQLDKRYAEEGALDTWLGAWAPAIHASLREGGSR
ncbi:NADPH-dependent FMN reductase [Leifsonia sp. 21MFCrub1.1]|uniref:NADPH-dependent FMN reductase n=1 Tax=Leifsonia sp. 21MFCrub1.1 TaxID=1798223 RepID=UPI0008929CE4|nr:NAD(P)H-dependent oxidoreductase [Leifsonia sp. 21MFCrub1.1]SEB10813.1 FMN reductase [Leifsonia sp. 21MFCrub1.1]